MPLGSRDIIYYKKDTQCFTAVSMQGSILSSYMYKRSDPTF